MEGFSTRTQWIIGSVCLIGFICAIYYREVQSRNLRAYGKVVIAKITSIEGPFKLGYSLEYNFTVDKSAFSGSSTFLIKRGCVDQLIGKYFYVKYEDNDPNNSELLLFREDLIQNEISLEDSLIWVEDCKN